MITTTKTAHHCAWVMTSHLRSTAITRFDAIALLRVDIEGIAAEEKISAEAAARLLQQRIGGMKNLDSYVKTLNAGQKGRT